MDIHVKGVIEMTTPYTLTHRLHYSPPPFKRKGFSFEEVDYFLQKTDKYGFIFWKLNFHVTVHSWFYHEILEILSIIVIWATIFSLQNNYWEILTTLIYP